MPGNLGNLHGQHAMANELSCCSRARWIATGDARDRFAAFVEKPAERLRNSSRTGNSY